MVKPFVAPQKLIAPARAAFPLTPSRLESLVLRKMFRVPPVMVRLPMLSRPVDDPEPGAKVPEETVTPAVVLPIPPRVPPLTVTDPPPVLAPLSIRVPELTAVVPA